MTARSQARTSELYACYTELTERLLAGGYPPYRLNVRSMHYVAGSDAYGHTLKALKAALDPHHILAPGRYEPGSAGTTVLSLARRDCPWNAGKPVPLQQRQLSPPRQTRPFSDGRAQIM